MTYSVLDITLTVIFQYEKSRLRGLRERTATAIFALAAKISKRDAFNTNSVELANEHKVL